MEKSVVVGKANKGRKFFVGLFHGNYVNGSIRLSNVLLELYLVINAVCSCNT
jgi:hypothetical protein